MALFEGDGEADGGVENLIVVGVVVDVAAEIVGVEAELIEKAFGGTELEVVAVGRLDRQAEDGWFERLNLSGAGEQDVLEGWSLKDAVVGERGRSNWLRENNATRKDEG